MLKLRTARSNRRQMFYKIGVFWKFQKIHKKTPVLEALFNKVKRCFPVNFGKFVRQPFLIEYLRWLLLKSNLKWFTLGYNWIFLLTNDFRMVLISGAQLAGSGWRRRMGGGGLSCSFSKIGKSPLILEKNSLTVLIDSLKMLF